MHPCTHADSGMPNHAQSTQVQVCSPSLSSPSSISVGSQQETRKLRNRKSNRQPNLLWQAGSQRTTVNIPRKLSLSLSLATTMGRWEMGLGMVIQRIHNCRFTTDRPMSCACIEWLPALSETKCIQYLGRVPFCLRASLFGALNLYHQAIKTVALSRPPPSPPRCIGT